MSSKSYKHTADMGEISGFGGSYEAACQRMLDAGVRFVLAQPDPLVVLEDSPERKDLEARIEAAEPECSGAMFHTVINRCVFVAVHGWEAYCERLRASRRKHSDNSENSDNSDNAEE